MAFVPSPGRSTRRNSRRAVGPQTKPETAKTFKPSPSRRVTANDAAIRMSRQSEPDMVYTTQTKSSRKRLRTDKKGRTTQTEFMPAREMEHISKVMGNANTDLDERYPQTRFVIGPAVFNASFSSGSHEPKDYAAPTSKQNVIMYPPIDEFIELKQTGKNTLKSLFKDQPNNKFRLRNWGIHYASDELDPVIEADQVTMPLKSTCGYNRTGVFNPLAFLNWGEQSSPGSNDASFSGAQNQWAVGGKGQLMFAMSEVIRDWFEASGQTPPNENTIIGYLTDYAAGMSSTSSLTFPVEEINETYTFRNENALTPCYLSVYHCTPKRPLGRRHDPITDWYDFQLGGGLPMPLASKTQSVKADSNLAFPAFFSQYSDDFAQISKNTSSGLPVVGSIDRNKYMNVTAISTEVVPQNTPFQSQVFRHHWDVINNKKIVLQPGQELKIHVKVKFARPIDIREILLGDSNFYYESLTYYPIIKFWGSSDVAQTKAKTHSDTFQYNRLREIIKPASCPCLLVGSKQGEIIVSGQMPPDMKSNYSQPAAFGWLNDFFGASFQGTKRVLSSPYIDLHEYGISAGWANINNNYAYLGIKSTDISGSNPTNPAVHTYFGLNQTGQSTEWATFSSTDVQAYLAQEIAEQATIVQETNVSAKLIAPALDPN